MLAGTTTSDVAVRLIAPPAVKVIPPAVAAKVIAPAAVPGVLVITMVSFVPAEFAVKLIALAASSVEEIATDPKTEARVKSAPAPVTVKLEAAVASKEIEAASKVAAPVTLLSQMPVTLAT